MIGPNSARYITGTSIEAYRQQAGSPRHPGKPTVTW